MVAAMESVSVQAQDALIDAPYDLTIDVLSRMAEAGLIPYDRRIYLRDGRIYEKMAKTQAPRLGRGRRQQGPRSQVAGVLEPLAGEHGRPRPHQRSAA